MDDEWVEVDVPDLRHGEVVVRVVNGEEVGIYNLDDELFCVGNRCTHMDASLASGSVRDGVVRCPRHGAEFDVRSGRCLGAPAGEDIRSYEIRKRGGSVEINLY